MVHGRWTCSVNCVVLVEQTDITLIQHINKEITGGVSAKTYRTLYYDKIKATHQSTTVHVVCLCSDHVHMFNSEYMNYEMIAILNCTSEF
jgi:hypothetical protein